MAKQYGLTPLGWVTKPQQVIITEITQSLQLVFGKNINTAPRSLFGNLIGIFSEREALVWQLGEAIYGSQYPSGAEGVSVDNILALNFLKRLPESASVVDLVLTGTPGTVIPKDSIAQTSATPPVQFKTDRAATIAASVDCVQTLFFSSVPDQGAFKLSIVDPNGNTLITDNLYWMSPAAAGASFVMCAVFPTSGHYKITVGGLTTGFLQWNDNAATVQAAIRALTGYGSVSVSGTNLSGGFLVTWTGVALAENRIAEVTNSTLDNPAVFGNSLQDLISVLNDTSDDSFPYADVTCTGAFNTGMIVTFGGASGDQAQNLLAVNSNTLFNGSVAVNINPVMTDIGTEAKATVSATCTEEGPFFAVAGAVNVIGTPVSGWTGVTNPLDVEPGSNIETDTEALVRRTTQLAAQASGPIQAIKEKVSQITNVKNVVAFENLNMAGSQILMFSAIPTTGNFRIQFGGAGSDQITANIAFNATAQDVQDAINVLFNLGDVVVEGDTLQGFRIIFGSSSGLGVQPLAIIYSSTIDVTVTPVQGLPGKSFEIIVNYPGLPVINDTLEAEIAEKIYETKPAGIQPFGAPIVSTTGIITAASDQLTSVGDVDGLAEGMMIIGQGIPINTLINSISGSTITMSNNATLSDTVDVVFKTAIPVEEEDGNTVFIQFSKPQLVPIYISVELTVSRKLFPANGVQQIQNDMVAIGDKLGIGDPVTLYGTEGLVGAFNSVSGIKNYNLFAGTAPSPVGTSNITLAPHQLAQIESFNIICTVTYE